jgi:hypothetical protein
VKPFENHYEPDDEEENAWLASVRLHCPRHQASRDEDLYWLEDVKQHTNRIVQHGRVTKIYLNTEEATASKARDQFERQWREWMEAK